MWRVFVRRVALIALLIAGTTLRFVRMPVDSVPESVAEAVWSSVSAQTPWAGRDSQGEAVLNGRIWILGGWTGRNEPILRDVWSSADGKDWRLESVEAPWRHGDLAMVTAFMGRLWVLGGWDGAVGSRGWASNEVWSSVDGRDWIDEGTASWSPRAAAAIAVFQDRLWIIGGTSHPKVPGSNLADVWSSKDGRIWRREVETVPWGERAYMQAVVHNGRLYVMGGGAYQPFYFAMNDVWSSEDGRTWRCETQEAPWSARIWFSSVALDKHLWVIGGWSNHPYTNHNDVWRSRDGKSWERVGSVGDVWTPRHEHSVVVHKGSLWVLGGYGSPMKNDVWKLVRVVEPK